MTIKYKSFVLFGLLTILGQTLTAQTYCMKYALVNNGSNVDVTVSLIASSSAFKLGSGNLQFKYKTAVLSTPTLVSNMLTATGNYNGLTVTEPTLFGSGESGDALVSFNYNFASGTGNGYPVSTSGAGTNIAVIRFHIVDGSLSPNIQPYDNGSMGTVVFDDNTLEPNLLSTAGDCPVYNVVLSVEWLNIKAYRTPKSEDKTVTIDWETASEKNNSHFIIERSVNGQTFETIGTTKAANKANKYSFIDVKPTNALNYYRIKQIDLDGTENVSKIESVSFKSSSKLRVYPSVTLDFLNVETEDKSDYSVVNTVGQQMLNGKTAKQIDMSSLAPGTYVLKIGEEQAKFVKQ